MVLGVTVNVYSLYVKSQGTECFVQTKHIHLALIMYASYFILFANFFFKAYFDKKNKKMK
jgi:elongation of very long chain fatty acids protein 6